MTSRSVLLFACLSLALCVFVHGDGLWGSSILAPLDIGSNLLPAYAFLDPGADGVPANQHLVDQFIYDLPLQKLIHSSLHAGEIPWWNPYGFGGRPLLADSHISGLDPVRLLLYLLLPFTLAYNWTLIAHSLLTGLGMFALLSSLKYPKPIPLLIALTYQFAGCYAYFFGHAWIQASAAYYPLLWLAWRATTTDGRGRLALSSLLVAATLYAGNLQSHVNLGLLAAAFAIGHGWPSIRSVCSAGLRILPSLVLGSLLAAPILLPTVELFVINTRNVAMQFDIYSLAALPLAFSFLFPWAAGTFRTLDLGRIANLHGLGFKLYLGSALSVLSLLAIAGAARGSPSTADRSETRTALSLIVLGILVLCSPLVEILYTRGTPLLAMALAVLAAEGLTCVYRSKPGQSWSGLATVTLVSSTVLVLAVNLGALVVYPRVMDQVRTWVLDRFVTVSLPTATHAVRSAQVAALPGEVSFLNPETVLAFAGLLMLGAVLRFPGLLRKTKWALPLFLVVNGLPLLMFHARFVPRSPVAEWHALERGGTDQQRLAEEMRDGTRRILETVAAREAVFPYALPALYRIHSVYGYAALIPPSAAGVLSASARGADPAGADADFLRLAFPTGTPPRTGSVALPPRFYWQGGNTNRAAEVIAESANRLTVRIAAGPPGTLVRTDTRYPGWRVSVDGRPRTLKAEGTCFSAVDLDRAQHSLQYSYRPGLLSAGLSCALAAIVVLLASGAFSMFATRHDSGVVSRTGKR